MNLLPQRHTKQFYLKFFLSNVSYFVNHNLICAKISFVIVNMSLIVISLLSSVIFYANTVNKKDQRKRGNLVPTGV